MGRITHQCGTLAIDAEPWFVAKDVCDALDIRVDNAMTGLDADEKGHCTVVTPGGEQLVRTVNESGLYSLILRSRKPEGAPIAFAP